MSDMEPHDPIVSEPAPEAHEASAAPEVTAAPEAPEAPEVPEAPVSEAADAEGGGPLADREPVGEVELVRVADLGTPGPSPALEAVLRDLRGEERRIERSLEALLVATRVPLSVEEMCTKLSLPTPVVEQALLRLAAALEERALGLFHKEKDGKRVYILDVKAAYRPDVAAVAPPLLKQHVTETLALIAMNQPISQSRLVRERGTAVYDHVKELLDRGLVQRLKQGRSYVLRTTDGFAAEFGLENDPALIRRALARAAGVQGDPEIMGSPRIRFDQDEAVAAPLLDEARKVAAETPRPAPAPETGAPASADGPPPSRLPADAFDAPQTSEGDCIISGGEAPTPNQEPAPERLPARVEVEPEEETDMNPEPLDESTRPTDARAEDDTPRGDPARLAKLLALTGDGGGDDW